MPFLANEDELRLSIAKLRTSIFNQEQIIEVQLKELEASLNPLTMITESIQDFAADKRNQKGLLKAGINITFNYFIEKLLKRNDNLPGFLGSVLLERLLANFLNKGVKST